VYVLWKFCHNNSFFVETYILFYSYLKLPLNRPLDTEWIGRA
jgi:hypothetical protein